MLLLYGSLKVPADWEVVETSAPGYCRVYYVYAGDVTYRDENTTEKLEKGCLYVFPSTIPYHMAQNSDRPLCCTFFHIDILPAFLPRMVKIRLRKNMPLYHLLQAAVYAIAARSEAQVTILGEALHRTLESLHIFVAAQKTVDQILRYIGEHCDQPLRLDELSRLCGYNPQYLIRLFKNAAGVSPYQHVISVKMKRAAELLSQGRTVTDTAELTGYKDIKMFSRAFKRFYKVPPSKYSAYRIP